MAIQKNFRRRQYFLLLTFSCKDFLREKMTIHKNLVHGQLILLFSLSTLTIFPYGHFIACLSMFLVASGTLFLAA